MKNLFLKILVPVILILTTSFNTSKSFAEIPYFIDFKYILNKSDAGKKAQDYLKKKVDNGVKNLQTKEAKLIEEEKKIIQQKKVLSAEEYKKKVTELRKKVLQIQKERSTLLESVARERSKARAELLKNLNPILNNYMKTNKIRMVVDKKSILLADENLDITKQIMTELNKKLKTINLK